LVIQPGVSFGGFKSSGIGSEAFLGSMVEAYTQVKTILIDHSAWLTSDDRLPPPGFVLRSIHHVAGVPGPHHPPPRQSTRGDHSADDSAVQLAIHLDGLFGRETL